MTLAAYLHDLSPFALRLTSTFGIRWYSLAYITGFIIAYLLMTRLARRGLILIPAHRVPDAMFWIIFGTLVGGRLGYVLVYQPELLWTILDHAPWWGLIAINEGGMASHGGMVGLTLAAWRISRGWTNDATGQVEGRCPMLHVMDVLALMSPFGVFFGRIANFINGELLGAIVSPPGTPGPWWTVQFPSELVTARAPALTSQQQTALADLVETAAPGRPVEAGLRRLVEHAHDYAQQLRPLLSSRHPSQLYQALAEGLVLGAFIWIAWLKPRKAGVIAALFLIAYGILRVITEIWRLPDAQFAVGRPMGLSRGQWLSVGMTLVGVWLLVFALRRSGPQIGGWARRTRAPAPDLG